MRLDERRPEILRHLRHHRVLPKSTASRKRARQPDCKALCLSALDGAQGRIRTTDTLIFSPTCSSALVDAGSRPMTLTR